MQMTKAMNDNKDGSGTFRRQTWDGFSLFRLENQLVIFEDGKGYDLA